MRGIKKVFFNNGLILLMEKRLYGGDVVILVATKSGSAYEKKEQSGITHFVEHMLYRSNQHRNTYEIAEELEFAGGDINGFVSQAFVFFYADTLPTEISNTLDIIYEVVTNDNYDKEEFYKEQSTILSEIKSRREEPFLYLYCNLFLPTLFKGTPLEKIVEGNLSSVNKLTPRQVAVHQREIFSPNRPMIISVVGKYNEEDIISQIKRTFGSMPQGVPAPTFNMSCVNKKNRKIEKRSGINQAYMAMGFQVPPNNHRDTFKISLLQSILVGGMSCRLFRELRNKRGIGYHLFSELENFEGVGSFCVGATINDSVRLDEAEEVINAELNDLKINLVGTRELEKAKNLTLKPYARDILHSKTRAIHLTMQEFQKTPHDFRKFEYYIRRLSAKSLREAAQKYFTDDYTFCALLPK